MKLTMRLNPLEWDGVQNLMFQKKRRIQHLN